MKNSKKKILVVDHSEMVRNFHSYIINMFGYEVAIVENGSEKLVKTIKMLL